MSNKVSYGILHCHSENSRYDSAMNVNSLIDAAAELGAPAVALTDHGTLMGVDSFVAAAQKKGINPIPGVEAYLKENINDPIEGIRHLILMPKDSFGYHAVCDAVTASNTRILSQKNENEYPCMNMEILNRFFGPNADAHGHVIAASACTKGVLASVILSNQKLTEEIALKESERNTYTAPTDRSYAGNTRRAEKLQKQIDDDIAERDRLKKLADRKFAGKEKRLDAAEGSPEYESLKAALEAEKQETVQAAKDLEKIKKSITKSKQNLALITKQIKMAQSSVDKYVELDNMVQAMKKELKDDKTLMDDAKIVAKQYDGLFGHGNFYIELMYHGTEDEAHCMPMLADIAAELDIPVAASNDVHAAHNSEQDFHARYILRSIPLTKTNQVASDDAYDRELYMKSDEELRDALLEILPEKTVNEAMENVGTICGQCHVEFPQENHYPKFISDTGETADEALDRMTREGIEWRFPDRKGWDKAHEDRMEYELNVIKEMGFSDYHLIVKDFLEYGRLLGKLPDEEVKDAVYDKDELKKYLDEKGYDVGQGIGIGRGSAVGSLVCYLLGITALDPIKYDLLFERFLNPERVSMPDIDSDFSPAIRDKMIDYVRNKYGKDSVTCIVTRGTQAAKAAIRNCGRILSVQKYHDKGVLLDLSDEIAKAIPNEPGTKLKNCVYDHWEDSDGNCYPAGDPADKPKDYTEVTGLLTTYAKNPDAVTIINDALLVEGTFTQYGMHAAGVIISDGKPVSDYVPLMWDEDNETWKTQCDKEQAENIHGLLKMDFLGLINLAIITDTLRDIKKREGIVIDVEKLPFKQEVFDHIFATARTNSVFQFESAGMKKMLKQVRPNCFEDLILLVAAYRPGPMKELPDVIAVKNGKKPLTYLVPELEPILNKTYGNIIYQEQVMQIFQSLAGYSLGQADVVRRYMAKKKMEPLIHERESFIYGDPDRNIKGCVANGIDKDKANELFDEMIDFGKYAFNKSHAAAYALVSYITGYLKYYYPTEYLTAALNHATDKKIPGLMDDCKHMKIEILPPDINRSENEFADIDNTILCGLGKIKNVGNGALSVLEERERGEFLGFKDFILRCKVTKTVTRSLIGAGAFDAFGPNRMAMTYVLEDVQNIAAKLRTKKQQLDELALVDTEKMTEKAKAAYDRKVETAGSAVRRLQDELSTLMIPNGAAEDNRQRLETEKSLLGFYVSGNPLDDYPSPSDVGCQNIMDIEAGSNTAVMGIIEHLDIKQRARDKKAMAFFDLEDMTGTVACCCFVKAYESYGELCTEGNIVKLTGNVQADDHTSDEEDEEAQLKFYISEIASLQKKQEPVMVRVKDMEDWTENVHKSVAPYFDPQGHQLLIHDQLTNEVRVCQKKVRKSILNDPALDVVLKSKRS